jgi:protein involved in polysaccharide export with SLBB domain
MSPRTVLLSLSLAILAGMPSTGRAQQPSMAGSLTTRDELIAAAAKTRNPREAADIKERLKTGDFQAGDRIVLVYLTDVEHRDTLVVRGTGVIDLPWQSTLRVGGVLRSEVQDLLAMEVRKYVKAERVEVTPLLRLGVLGEVARPGYFAFSSDMPVTDVVMSAGGPTALADMRRTTVRRLGQQLKSSDETGRAISAGLTLDQFGLSAGDELVIAQRRQGGFSPVITTIGVLATVVTAYVALRR